VLPTNHARAAAAAGITDARFPTSDDVTSAWLSPWFVDMVRFAFTIGFPKKGLKIYCWRNCPVMLYSCPPNVEQVNAL
jgi:hypothetical protein